MVEQAPEELFPGDFDDIRTCSFTHCTVPGLGKLGWGNPAPVAEPSDGSQESPRTCAGTSPAPIIQQWDPTVGRIVFASVLALNLPALACDPAVEDCDQRLGESDKRLCRFAEVTGRITGIIDRRLRDSFDEVGCEGVPPFTPEVPLGSHSE